VALERDARQVVVPSAVAFAVSAVSPAATDSAMESAKIASTVSASGWRSPVSADRAAATSPRVAFV
jgi:hypothetical protein